MWGCSGAPDGGEVGITEDADEDDAAAAAAAREWRACEVARFSMSRLLSEICLDPSSGSLSVPVTDKGED